MNSKSLKDTELDEYILKLLESDARKHELQQKRGPGPSIRPNANFLERMIRQTKSHNDKLIPERAPPSRKPVKGRGGVGAHMDGYFVKESNKDNVTESRGRSMSRESGDNHSESRSSSRGRRKSSTPPRRRRYSTSSSPSSHSSSSRSRSPPRRKSSSRSKRRSDKSSRKKDSHKSSRRRTSSSTPRRRSLSPRHKSPSPRHISPSPRKSSSPDTSSPSKSPVYRKADTRHTTHI